MLVLQFNRCRIMMKNVKTSINRKKKKNGMKNAQIKIFDDSKFICVLEIIFLFLKVIYPLFKVIKVILNV